MTDTAAMQTLAGKVEFTETGLKFTGALTFDEWQVLGRGLLVMYRRVHWWIGDWLNYGEARYGQKYTQALATTGFDYGTLANDKYVAARFQFSPRSENLSFSHHKAVAPLPAPQAQALLERAERERWTVAQLYEARRTAAPDYPTPPYPTTPRERQLLAIADALLEGIRSEFRHADLYRRAVHDLERIRKELEV